MGAMQLLGVALISSAALQTSRVNWTMAIDALGIPPARLKSVPMIDTGSIGIFSKSR